MHAAIDVHGLAGNIARRITAQKAHQRGDFSRLTKASQGDILQHEIALLLWQFGLSSITFTLVYLHWRGSTGREILGMGRPGVAAAVIGALATAAFIPAFKYTTIANVSLIYAAVPFVAEVKPDLLVYGGENVLTVRVHNSTANGGIWRPVRVHAQK